VADLQSGGGLALDALAAFRESAFERLAGPSSPGASRSQRTKTFTSNFSELQKDPRHRRWAAESIVALMKEPAGAGSPLTYR
jgi:hypothetical protein